MRLFIAIRPTEDIRKALAGMQDSLLRRGLRGTCVPAEDLHMTLSFIGEHPDPAAVLEAMKRVGFAGFSLMLDEVGIFNNNVLWAGARESEPLEVLVRRLRYELARADIPFDCSGFLPHFTLLRNVDDGRGLPETRLPGFAMAVESISLFRCDPGKTGSVYTELGTVGASDGGAPQDGKTPVR